MQLRLLISSSYKLVLKGAADQVFVEGMLRDGKEFSETGEYAIRGATMFEQPFINMYKRINEGYYTGSYAKDANGNTIEDAQNYHGAGALVTDFYYATLSLMGLKAMVDVSRTTPNVPLETLKVMRAQIKALTKFGKGILLERQRSLLDPNRTPFKPYELMTEAEIKAFNHAISRHGHQFGLKWGKKSTLPKLVDDYNAAVSRIRNEGRFMGIEEVQHGIKGSNRSGRVVDANVYNLSENGKIYYYWETTDGKFISAGEKTNPPTPRRASNIVVIDPAGNKELD